MKFEACNCQNCGGPVRVLDGQFVTQCKYCRNRYYIPQDTPPLVALKPDIDINTAKSKVLAGLRHPEVSKTFLSRSFFERADLFFIPFYEIRGVKAGWGSPGSGEPGVYTYQAFDCLEIANSLDDLKVGEFDVSLVERALLQAQPAAYDHQEMRQKGLVLPVQKPPDRTAIYSESTQDTIEQNIRVIYFPIWEISYTYMGIIFRSYISAINGEIIKIHAIRNQKRKTLTALVGLFSLAILLARGLKMATFMVLIDPFSSLSLAFILIILPFLLFLASILLPFLWEMYAFREEIALGTDTIEGKPIRYTENTLIKCSNKFSHRFGKLIEKIDEEFFDRP